MVKGSVDERVDVRLEEKIIQDKVEKRVWECGKGQVFRGTPEKAVELFV